jgi:formimidoylglutamase
MTPVDPLWPRADVWLASDAADPDILLVGVPSSTASLVPSRADLAPLVVRDRLGRFSTYHGEMGLDFGAVAVRDVGNWPVTHLVGQGMIDEVTRLAAALPDAGLRIHLGGDNAITRPLVGAVSDDLSRVGLITFDAHHDVRSLDGGPNNGNPIRGLIEEDGLPGGNVVQIGIHSFANSAPYRAYCEENGLSVVTIADVERDGMETVVEEALDRLEQTCDTIYVDVDVDVLDAVFAPACPGSRPGGLTVRQLAAGVARCARHPMVSAIDFVEVDPTLDHNHVTIDTTAHLLLTAVAGFGIRGSRFNPR